MKKILFASAVAAIVLCSCAAPEEKKMTEEYWTLSQPMVFWPEDMLSEDLEVRAKALVDYPALTDDSKKKVITYLVYMLADEKDASKRHDIFDLLRDIKAGPLAIRPLIQAYGRARQAGARTEISRFIAETRPAKLSPAEIGALLEDKNWDVRIKAARVLSTMKTKAGSSFPEIINAMRQTGPSYGLYEEFYDLAAEINADAAFASAALDLAGGSKDLKESAMRILYETYTGEKASVPLKNRALQALVRVLFTGDAEFSGMAKKMLEESGTAGAKAKIAEFEAFKSMKVISMKDLTAEKMNKKFAEEEDDIYLTLKLYYSANGRADAVKDIPQVVHPGVNL